MAAEDPSPQASRPQAHLAAEVFAAFLRQGLTAFGGPVAHLAFFRREFVEKRGWLTEAAFADLLALCHFLPGASSSQLGMAIGLRRAGVAGAVAAWIGFTLPAAVAMIAVAYAAPGLSAIWGDGWIHGLKIAAAAVVLQALIAMARSLAQGPIRAGMAIGAAAGLVIAHGPVAQIFAIAAGALLGRVLLQEPQAAEPADATPHRRLHVPLAALTAFVALLAFLPLLAGLLQSPLLGLASVFYRTGALVFGGGHVVLPLLQAEVVDRGWIDQDIFLAGYGAMQALPGPLFSFAGFVGAAQTAAQNGWIGGLVAVTAIFTPSLLLVIGVVPVWDRVKASRGVRAAVSGACAVVVGVLAAALWDPILANTVGQPSDWALVAAAFVFLTVARLPPWLVVIGFGAATALFLR